MRRKEFVICSQLKYYDYALLAVYPQFVEGHTYTF